VKGGVAVIFCNSAVCKHLTMHPFEFVHQLFIQKDKYHNNCTCYTVVLQDVSTSAGPCMTHLKMFGSKFL
jgi:hypothetical protein